VDKKIKEQFNTVRMGRSIVSSYKATPEDWIHLRMICKKRGINISDFFHAIIELEWKKENTIVTETLINKILKKLKLRGEI